MQKEDLYKLRAEDFARNFESLRQIEWRATFQVYTGYAAIVVAYWHLRPKYPSSGAIGWAAVAFTVVLFIATTYLSLRIQERLHHTRDMQNEYLKKLHEFVPGAPELPRPATTRQPIHGKWYAFAAQTVLSSLTMIGLVVFEIATTCTPC